MEEALSKTELTLCSYRNPGGHKYDEQAFGTTAHSVGSQVDPTTAGVGAGAGAGAVTGAGIAQADHAHADRHVAPTTVGSQNTSLPSHPKDDSLSAKSIKSGVHGPYSSPNVTGSQR